MAESLFCFLDYISRVVILTQNIANWERSFCKSITLKIKQFLNAKVSKLEGGIVLPGTLADLEGTCPVHGPPKGPDSLVLTYKI